MKFLRSIYLWFFIIAGLIFLIWFFFSIGNGSGFTHFLGMVFKLIMFTCLFSVGIALINVNSIRRKWTDKIYNALNGPLGNKIKQYVANDSICYWILADRITYLNKNNQYCEVYFSELGYENIAGEYADIVCDWLSENWLKEPQNYLTSGIYGETETYVGGEPDVVKTVKTYDGYESYTVPGYRDYKTTRYIKGYRLAHFNYYKSKAKPTLKKW